MTSIRLNKELENSLGQLSEKEGVSKSDIIREALAEYLERKNIEATPWELGENIFGKYGSGRNDLSVNRKKILREKIRDKRKSD